MGEEEKLTAKQVLLFYGLWMISGLLCVLDWLVLRQATTAVAAAIAEAIPIEAQIERQWFARWPVAAIDKFSLVCLGIVAILFVMGLDYLYRAAIAKGRIVRRFGIVTAIQVGLLILSAVAILVASRLV